ncbi:MAG: hypothetical protein M3Y27_24655 [Acidobacteriota bacterium]|nr:hypothetical protein [Acidobacteriota bacterium]
MMVTGRKNILERDAGSDLWRHTLSRIPSVFGRLVYLSSLRNPNNARYRHDGLALVFGEDEANRALRKGHNHAFAEWLTFNIEEQKADLDLYLSGLLEEKHTVLNSWINLAHHRSLIPNSAKSVERRLYLADFQAILELVRNEYAVDDPDPVA